MTHYMKRAVIPAKAGIQSTTILYRMPVSTSMTSNRVFHSLPRTQRVQRRNKLGEYAIHLLLVLMFIRSYLFLSTSLYVSLPNGNVMDKFDKWMTIYEIANYIKMSRTKLYGMAQRGEIPASKIGNQWRFDREEIDQWMKAHATGKRGSKA